MTMHIDMVYDYPIWAIGVLVVLLSVGAAMAVELVARRVIPLATRREHNDVAAAMFSVVGVTFAVLLAFVAMLTFEGLTSARLAAASEAAAARDVANAAEGLAGPMRSSVRGGVGAYIGHVIGREWPAQANGHFDDSGAADLLSLGGLAAGYRVSGPADGDYHAALLAALGRLQDARALRQLSAGSTVPAIVWIVMLLGGGLTVASGSFLGAPSVRMHLAMSATLATSGALVVVLTIALSQPFRGVFRVSTLPFERVAAELAGGAPGQ